MGGRSDNAVVRVLSWPGLMMQKLTTREPDEEQLEVAITSLKAVLGELEPGVISKQNEDVSDDLVDANEEEELNSIFDDLEDKRYSDDETMVKNLVRAGESETSRSRHQQSERRCGRYILLRNWIYPQRDNNERHRAARQFRCRSI